MTRRAFIERIIRQIYGGWPSDDAAITPNLINNWLQDAIGLAAKTNYKDNIAIDGISYISNSFYTRFSDLSISSDGNFLWKLTLPQIPFGIGATEGISVLELKDNQGNVTRPFVPLTENQRTIYKSIRPIPNKVLYYYEGEILYAVSTLILSQYTANVTMVSGGDSSNLDSTLNVPADYYPVMVEYIQKQLIIQRSQPVDLQNDGSDFVKST